MKANNALKNELEKYNESVGSSEKFIFSVINANFQGKEHSMLIGGEFDLKEVYKELSDLEKADLFDYFNAENNERTD